MEESGEQWKHGGTSFAILKENRLLAVAPPRPVPESRYEQVETCADVSTARRIGIMSHYCPGEYRPAQPRQTGSGTSGRSSVHRR